MIGNEISGKSNLYLCALKQKFIKGLSKRVLRTQEPGSACILDGGLHFTLGLIKAVLSNEEAVAKQNIQAVAKAVADRPDVLIQVGFIPLFVRTSRPPLCWCLFSLRKCS